MTEVQETRIRELVPASYNPRKKLKPGDKEYEKIKRNTSTMMSAMKKWSLLEATGS